MSALVVRSDLHLLAGDILASEPNNATSSSSPSASVSGCVTGSDGGSHPWTLRGPGGFCDWQQDEGATPDELHASALSYATPDGQAVLSDVSFSARGGQLVLVLGASGAGKTTLLHLLAQLPQPGRTSGRLLLSEAAAARASALVMQNDVFLPGETVAHTADFYARVQQPQLSAAARAALVHSRLSALGLQERADTAVRDLSGGERRRLAVLVELLARGASRLLLDEPTSGLSATEALALASRLRSLAHAGLLVVASVHQPRAHILELADQLVVLAHGRCVFAGPPALARSHFAPLGARFDTNSPADALLDFVASLPLRAPARVAFAGGGRERVRDVEQLAELWTRVAPRVVSGSRMVSVGAREGGAGPDACALTEVQALAARTLRTGLLDPTTLCIRISITAVMACCLGSLFWGTASNAAKLAALFYVFCYLVVSSIVTMPALLLEHELYVREHITHKYSLGSLVLGNALGTAPMEALVAALFTVATYELVGLRQAGPAAVVSALVACVGGAYNQLCASLAPRPMGAFALSGFSMAVFMLFMGYFVPLDSIPHVWRWAYYASYWQWGFAALMRVEFAGASASCSVIDQVKGECVRGMTLLGGDDLLSHLQVPARPLALACAALGAFYAAFKLLHWAVLAARASPSWHWRAALRRNRVLVLTGATVCVALLLAAPAMTSCNPGAYSSFDGTCHKQHAWAAGRAGASMQWAFVGEGGAVPDAAMAAGDAPRRLPNPRELSNRLFASAPGFEVPDARNHSLLQLMVGLFFVHDSFLFAPDGGRPAAVPVPQCDEVFDPECSGNVTLDISMAHEHNAVSAWVDLSPVYGSSREVCARIREWAGGRVRLSADGYLPLNDPPGSAVQQMEGEAFRRRPLMLAGDVRANEHVGLLAMHTLFAREHNRLAAELSRAHPHWADEQLFLEARQQNIHSWNELITRVYIPSYLNDGANQQLRAYPFPPVTQGSYNIQNDFMALYRLHSMLPERWLLVNASGHAYLEYSAGETAFAPEFLLQHGLDNVLRGLAHTPIKRYGTGYAPSLRNIVTRSRPAPAQPPAPVYRRGFDLCVLDLVRARQFRVPPYNYLRRAYGLAPAVDWSDLSRDPARQAALRELYGHVDAVEALVGAHEETLPPGHSLPTLVLANAVRHVARFIEHDNAVRLQRAAHPEYEEFVFGRTIARNTQIGCVPRFPNRMPGPANPTVCW